MYIAFEGCYKCSVKVLCSCRRNKSFILHLLTAFNFQGAVLFIKRVPSQVHHASSSGGYSKKKKDKNRTDTYCRASDITKRTETECFCHTPLPPPHPKVREMS